MTAEAAAGEARLRQRIAELEAENSRLRAMIETLRDNGLEWADMLRREVRRCSNP